MYAKFSTMVAKNNQLRIQTLPSIVGHKEDCFIRKHANQGYSIDIGCGFGRLFDLLQKLGHQIVGIDSCPEIVTETKELFPDVEIVNAEMHVEDSMLRAVGSRLFDNIFCLGNTFGGLFSTKDQRGFARVCSKIAANKSRLFIDRIDFESVYISTEDCFDLFGAERNEYRGKGGIFSFQANGDHSLAQYYPSTAEINEEYGLFVFEYQTE
ncbi:class I SAM-dependent methyltransferase [Candidatus Margulisiibacteriota bacterium]